MKGSTLNRFLEEVRDAAVQVSIARREECVTTGRPVRKDGPYGADPR